jgi:hypothetical protein
MTSSFLDRRAQSWTRLSYLTLITMLSPKATALLLLLIRRGPDGVIMPKNHTSPEDRVGMFRWRVRKLVKTERDAYIAACPTKCGEPREALVARLLKADNTIWREGVGPKDRYHFNGDLHDYNDELEWSVETLVDRWERGDSYHHQQDYQRHLSKIKQLCEEIDEVVGEFVFFTVSEYNPEIRDRYEDDWSDSIPWKPLEKEKLDFAIALESALEYLWSDCLYHKLLAMNDDDLAFFACTLSRLPTRPDNGIFAM